MKKNYLLSIVAMLVCNFLMQSQVFPTWTGIGNNWSDNSNWTTSYGYGQLQFTGSGNTASNNDFSPDTAQWRLFFQGSQSYSLTGNPVNLFDFGGQNSWILSQSSVDQTINLNISFSDGGVRPSWITTQDIGNLIFNGNINVAGAVTELYLANTVPNGRIIVNGTISGDDEIFIGRDQVFGIQPTTSVEFTGINTYTADTFIDGGALRVSGGGTLGTNADVFISAGSFLFIDNDLTVESVQERGGSNSGVIEISGGNSLRLNGNDKGNIFQNSINGSGDLIIETSGSTILNLFGVNDLSGTTTIKNGSILKLRNSMANSDIIIEAGGTLEIEGNAQVTVKSITNNGTLQINGNQSLKVLNDLVNNGLTNLSLASGGDIFVGGDFSQNGTLNNNQRAIFFDGGTNQTVSSTSAPISFDYVRVDKSGGTLFFSEDVEINQPAGGNGYEQNNGDVTVNTGKYLRVNNTGNFILNSGSFTLESLSNSYASLVVDNVTNNGTISYNRHVNNVEATSGNDLISAPLTGEAFNTFIARNPNILQEPEPGIRVLFGGFDQNLNEFELWNETDTFTLNAGEGYRAGVDAAASTDLVNFQGDVNTGIVNTTIDLGTISKWNLIGNPYPSYLSAQDLLSSSVNQNTFTTDPDFGTDINIGVIYGYNDGTGTGAGGIYTPLNALTAIGVNIAPGQGFFMASNSITGSTIEFTPSMRRATGGDDFIEGRNAVVTNIKLGLSSMSDSFFTDVFFTQFSTLGFDPGYDSGLFGAPPAFALYSNLVEDNVGDPFAIQALGETDYTNVTVPLGVNASQGIQITFNLTQNTLPNNIDIYLDDTEENISVLLNSSDYVLTPSSNLSGTGRFFLRFADSSLSNPTSSIEDIAVYTDRTNQKITIAGELEFNTKCNIYDIQGRLIKTRDLNSALSLQHINVTNFTTGIYIVELSNGTESFSKKVILN